MDYFKPDELQDTAAASLRKDLGQQAQLEGELVELREQLERLPENSPASERASMMLEIGRALQILERGDESWPIAHTAFGILSPSRNGRPPPTPATCFTRPTSPIR